MFSTACRRQCLSHHNLRNVWNLDCSNAGSWLPTMNMCLSIQCRVRARVLLGSARSQAGDSHTIWCGHSLMPHSALLFQSHNRSGSTKARSVQGNARHREAQSNDRNAVQSGQSSLRGNRMIEWCRVSKERRRRLSRHHNHTGNAKSPDLFSFDRLLKVRPSDQSAFRRVRFSA